MYCVQFCYDGYSRVVAIFDNRVLASEYALFKKRTSKDSVYIDKPIAIEVLDGDKQLLRLLV